MGFEKLQSCVAYMFYQGKDDLPEDVYITRLRHKDLLEGALESLDQVIASIDADMPEDFYSIDLMHAYASLGYILGEAVDEDVINEVFENFCMGK